MLGPSISHPVIFKAIEYYAAAAKRNDPLGLGCLGMHYINGVGVRRDAQKGFGFLRRAVEDFDDEEWQLAVAHAYFNGNGTKQDYTEAMRWYRRAASSGSREAFHQLAYMYHIGLGVEKDDKEALKFYRLSQEK